MSVQLMDANMRPTGEGMDEWEASKYIACLERRIADLEGELQRRGLNVDDFRRADQNAVCQDCSKTFSKHPFGGPITYDRSMILRRLCNGELVKL